jgi:hypothetical protein
MQNNLELLKCMDDAMVVNALRAQSLSPIEQFLLDRLEAMIEDKEENAATLLVVDEYDLSAADLECLADAMVQDAETTAELLNTLAKAGIDSVGALTRELHLADALREFAEGDGDMLDRINALITIVEEG